MARTRPVTGSGCYSPAPIFRQATANTAISSKPTAALARRWIWPSCTDRIRRALTLPTLRAGPLPLPRCGRRALSSTHGGTLSRAAGEVANAARRGRGLLKLGLHLLAEQLRRPHHAGMRDLGAPIHFGQRAGEGGLPPQSLHPV